MGGSGPWPLLETPVLAVGARHAACVRAPHGSWQSLSVEYDSVSQSTQFGQRLQRGWSLRTVLSEISHHKGTVCCRLDTGVVKVTDRKQNGGPRGRWGGDGESVDRGHEVQLGKMKCSGDGWLAVVTQLYECIHTTEVYAWR